MLCVETFELRSFDAKAQPVENLNCFHNHHQNLVIILKIAVVE